MSSVISISNIKGGVGKSTVAINLAGYLSKFSKVYLVDADPQGSVSDWYGIRLKNDSSSLLHKNLTISDEPYSFNDLKTRLSKDSKSYDYTIIDCPPEDDRIMRTALVISDYTIIPVTPSPFDIRSANKTIQTIKEGLEKKATKVNPYILISKKIVGTVLGREAREALQVFKIPVLKTEITQRIALCEAGIHGKTIFEYAYSSISADEFMKLGKEVRKW